MEKLKKIFNVSSKIHMFAQRKYSTTRLQQEEHERNLVILARELRKERLSKLEAPEKFILEYAADFYDVDLDEIIAGVVDSDSHVTDLKKLLVADGLYCTFICYGPKIGTPITSGRYDPKLRYASINRAVVQSGNNVRLKDMWLVGYRKSNSVPVNFKTIYDEVAVFAFGGEGRQIALFAVKEHLIKVVTPALQAIEVFGICSERQRVRFFHRIDMFNKFLISSNEEVEDRVIFYVSNHLYKGFLLAKYQIEATAKDRNKVKEVEWYFAYWLRKIQVILNEGKQLEYDPPDVGPLQMLQRWRRKVTWYKSVTEFINKSAFQNHFTCLCLSRSSKLLKKWKLLHHEVTTSLNEASENLRYMSSLQTFWDPLYMGTPRDVLFAIETLLVAIRSVSKSANYFNTCDNVTGLLVKITNQLTLSLRQYLTNNYKKSIWGIKSKTLIDNIETCKEVMEAYKKNFFKTIKDMKEAKEKPWIVSPVYIFCCLEKFSKRLDKIKNIANNEIIYSILDRVRINGMEKFANAIKGARAQIDRKPYDPLNFHIETFNDDYVIFMKAVESEELKMQQFVKRQIEGFPLAESMLLVLKRFEKLNLDCLCMDRRYLDVAELLEKEIFMLKDIYNLQRRNPPIPRNAPPMGGRIVWIRMLHQRIDVPMQVIKTKPCVLGHEKAQRTVKFYNYMSGIVLHYEMMHQKAWFDYVEEVRPYLHMPVLKRDQYVAIYRVNLHESVYRLMRETEYFWKLKIHVPGLANLVTYCKSNIIDAFIELQKFVKEYEKFRNSVCSTLINIMRFQLKDLELAIKPGTFYIKWTSEELGDFVLDITKRLNKLMEFYKNANTIQNTRVQKVLDSITEKMLAYIPSSPIDPDDFLAEANRYRQKCEKEIEFKSQSAEKAVIEMINFFVDEIDFPVDIPSKSGVKRQFQLPLDKINDENWKKESRLPIDKYDWIQFDKIYRTIWFVPEETRISLGIKEYENFHYGLKELRNDCMDIFSHFNSKVISALVLSTKRSLDAFRKTLLNPSWKTLQLQPVITTVMELDIPYCTINPTLDQIQSSFQQVYLNAVEICYFISTWGKQAKTAERRNRKITPDENRHERSFFKVVSEHKDVVRALQNLSSGLSMFRYDIDQVLKQTYEKHQFIWADDREAQIKKFVENNPLIVEIRDKFMQYDKMTQDLTKSSNFINVGPIQIRLEKTINSFVEESKNWKLILGRILSTKYKAKLEEMTEFISEQLNILGRQIKDLDDVRQAMNCLERIRDNQIEMEIGLDDILEVYNLFNQFNISVEQEDLDKVDILQSTFNKMIEDSKSVSLRIIEMQGPLLRELNEGIKTFTKELVDFNSEYELKGPMVEGIPAKEASDRVYIFQSKFDELWRKFEMCSSGEKLFGLPVTDYPILHQRKREFGYLNKLYSLYIMVLKTIDEYMNITWVNVDIEKITAELQDFQLRCRKLPKGMQTWPAFIDLKKKIDDFNETVPLLELMTNKAMKDRHWSRINSILGTDFDPESSKFVLGLVLKAQILRFKDDVEDICVGAVKELDIEAKLNQVLQDWSIVNLQTAPFKSRGELLLRGGETMDIITSLEDSVMVMNSLASNRYNAPFKKKIMVLLKKLVNTGEILERWLMVQNLWMYLEAVFVGGDIAKQLPLEAKRFSDIDKKYVKIMYRVREISNAVECCTGDEILAATLIFLTEQLEACQKSLTGYLEKKRLVFPRFFFVSDPVLLEILGQASDPTTIQPHLLSIFDAIATVDFQEGTKNVIIAMNSSNGEKVRLESSVQCQGGVELWLGKLLKEMQDTIKNILSGVSISLSDPHYNFLLEFPSYCGQAALVGIQILWTKDSETALRRSRIDRSIMKQTNQSFLNILNFLIELTIKDLTKLERIRYETMVTIHVHQRDIFDDLFRLKIKSISDFEWQKQARFYFIENSEDVIVSITDVNFIYQNEYLGVTERLAITPLTDRCYITLAQAVGMCMGGAPAGPAGTGKTETTKDMGRALGKLVVVFNCSDQMDFRGLARIFKGLAQSGSWGCFDEFNRIELPVLSVAAQQIYIVLTARKERKTHFIFSDGDIVSLNPEFGLFITMNPGYAGRQELPENLKIQFRSVAMMVPDRQIIMRVKLASCGFKENVPLSRKFYTLYKLCEEQLSKQVHYDFGLRNILSVLRTLGAQKRAQPDETEETILMRVLKDMNVSKLTDEDEPLFQSLIEDMFPGIKLTTSSYKELQRSIASSAAALGYVNSPEWNLKVVQLYESSLVRHGLMLMGPTGSGKTSCTQTLLMAFTDMGKPHKEMRMNPKAITAPQMFGRLDVATNDWTDGIFSTLWRRTWKVKPGDNVWLILDGPVDAVWIENLNSVLDDNKTLTLANGDRIKMAESCKLVFEPDNVDNASPATVSRVGMVYTSSSVVKWNVYLEAWFMRHPNETEVLRRNFENVYDDVNTFVQTKIITKMKLLEAIYITQFLSILDGLLDGTTSEKYLDRIFVFCLMWSVGAVLEISERIKLEDFLTKHHSKLKLPKRDPNETIFEYYVEKPGQWVHWSNRVEKYDYPDESIPEYAGILIPNVDNVRTAFLLHNIAKQRKGVLLIGEQGTAKTVMIKGYMLEYDPEDHMSKSFNFSSATTPNMYQKIIESYVEKRVGLTYGPPGQRRMTIFVDDINMPVINEWGDQITNEIVRQMIEQGGFYALDKPGDFYTITDIQLLAAMIHPGGGRNDVPNRLKRQFCVFNCTLPSNNSMDQIFRSIGEGYFCLSRFNEQVVHCVPYLVPLTRIFWQNVKVKMLPTPANFHYVFNLRDLSRIWEGMLTIQGPECTDVVTLMKLWRHECCRVIADRFTDMKDKTWFLTKMSQDALKHLGSYAPAYDETETYFVDFLRDPVEAEDDEDVSLEPPKIYEEIPSFEFVINKVLFYMRQFNEYVRGFSLDLVFFKDALCHLMIISRILRTPRGNALLVGVGGSGKQSLTRLASFIAGYKFHQIVLTRAYNAGNLAEDLKFLYRTAGLEGHGITFIFTDNEIKEEGFLEFINNVLSSGEIAGLFPKDELDEIFGDMIPVMKKLAPKRPPTQDNLYDFFLSRARFNLHIALCFSPIGDKFRARALKFPGLISGCTIDWFQKWSEDGRVAVSRHYLEEFDIVCEPIVKENLIEIMSFIHDSVSKINVTYFEKFRRQFFVTPKTLISFLESYKHLYSDKRQNIVIMAERMSSGLYKLDEAAISVSLLKVDLIEMNQQIEVANAAAEVVLNEVASKSAAAEVVKAQVLEVKSEAEALVVVISADKAVAEVKLEKARPALEEAEAALKTIKAADIATVRKLGKPPYLITLIMDCVIIYFGKHLDPVRPDMEKQFIMSSWADALKVMADTRFLSKILEFPTDTINGEMIDLLTPYFIYPQYNLEAAKVACGNVAGLLSWTVAMAKYYEVNKEVLPLKANLAVQEAKYRKAAGELKAAEDLFAAKEAELAEVQKAFKVALEKKEAVQAEAKKVQDKTDAATALINGLKDEKIRWTEQLAQFKSETDRLVGDVIYLTGFLSYTGPFNQEFRSVLLLKWYTEIIERKIPISTNINIIDSLTDRTQIGEWNLQGLPTDDLSIQNGIIATKAFRYPLLIDPQSQGKIWIKNKEKINNLLVTSLNHKYFRNHIEDSVSMGFPILIEDFGEELDPCLDNVLDRNIIKVGTTYKIKVGDKEVDYNRDFRLYITTKLSNPAYTPEICARAAIIDFTVTMKGLEDQLLGRVIITERKELEDERTELVETVTGNLKLMKELEANLLHKLSTTEGSLLDDVTVIQVLNISKKTANEVKEKLAIAKVTEEKINNAREEYRPVATRGSVLYFLVTSMTMVNCMYQTALVQFLERFDASMANSQKTHITQKRIRKIIRYLTFEIYRYKSRGLYETHKYLFVLLMALNIDIQMKIISYEEFQNFIKGGAALNLKDCPPKPHKWITDETWLNIVQLSNLRQFSNIVTQIDENERGWRLWFNKARPESESIPDGYNNLDVFKKLLLIRAWCPDRTVAQSRAYISNSLGSHFVNPIILSYDDLLAESRPLTPLICFLSMGSDPSPTIEVLAKKNETTVRAISMGQGQEIHARKLMLDCLENGGWVLLQNCHLGLEYMQELVLQLNELEKENTGFHDNFRLWITTEVHIQFPITLLQISIKYTNEPPAGLRAGLKRTYGNLSQDFLDYSESPFYHPLVFGISFLHSIVQERRKFGPLGWNIPYEFNSADWLASCMFVQNHLDDIDPKRGISWVTVRYMLGEIQYGGRVTDDYDKRLLNTFARVWFSEAMFAQDFQFYHGYKMLRHKLQEEYLTSIEDMPGVDAPQALGFHPNADITYQTNVIKSILETIVSIQPKESAGAGEMTREDKVAMQTKEMLNKMPPIYDLYDVKQRVNAMGALNSLNIFLRQEIDRMQKILILVRATLRDLLLAIEGTIIMSDQLRDALDNIFNARVPQLWLKGSWASSTLGFWYSELLERNSQFYTWCYHGRPIVFWMSGFFNPQGFLTAMKQEVARAHKGWALDQVSLQNDVLKQMSDEFKKPPKEGVFVHGLYLDGAGWDKKNSRLIEAANKVLYVLMPVIHIYALGSIIKRNQKLYECPVYKKINRTDLNFITPLWMDSLKSPDHWVLRGVALLGDIK